MLVTSWALGSFDAAVCCCGLSLLSVQMTLSACLLHGEEMHLPLAGRDRV